MTFPAAVRATPLLGAVAAGAGAPAFAERKVERQRHERRDYREDYYACSIHRNSRYAARAQTQATAHWKNTTIKAHFDPSSRRMDAMAATQGV